VNDLNDILASGDVDVGRSQLGKSWSGLLTSPDLWVNELSANRYCFTLTGDASVRMPAVGTLTSEAQPGYWVTITNINTSVNPFALIVYDVTGLNELAVLYPTCSATLIANLDSVTNWTVTQNTSDFVRAQLRAGVDPTSNPDPITGGLIVPAGSTQFNMPITVSPQSIGLADPFITDSAGFYQVASDGINIMYNNDYQASFNIYIIGTGAIPNQLQVGQILEDGQSIFNAPPICSANDYDGSVVTVPLGGIIWLLTGTANFTVTTAPVKIVMRLLINNTTDFVIALTSNISIEKI
jgi:hypothetical protein